MFHRGNPDKCDYTGNTALHLAAGKGNMPCVSFLVEFGVNVWSLDNEFYSALDLAALHNHSAVVQYLDAEIVKRQREHPKWNILLNTYAHP